MLLHESTTHQTETKQHPPKGFQMLRKLLQLGNSYAVTIPTAWVKEHVDQRLPYVTTVPNDDGSITLRAYDPRKPIGAT